MVSSTASTATTDPIVVLCLLSSNFTQKFILKVEYINRKAAKFSNRFNIWLLDITNRPYSIQYREKVATNDPIVVMCLLSSKFVQKFNTKVEYINRKAARFSNRVNI